MSPLILLAVAVALSLDAAAEAIARGNGVRRPSWAAAVGMGVVFAGFQILLPCLGWWLAVSAQGLLAGHDRWVACILLATMGARMLWEATTRAAEADAAAGWPSPVRLLGLGLVTSLDGFAAGVGFATLGIAPLLPALVIGALTLVVTVLGARQARLLGLRGARVAAITGGLLLIAIGIGIVLGPNAI